jgi:hypothetical protein
MELLSKRNDSRRGELRRFEHAGDRSGSHCLSDLRSATQRPAGHARSDRQFRLDAPWPFAWRRYSGSTNPFGVGLLLCFCSVARPARRFCLSSLNLQKGNLPFDVGAMVLLMVIRSLRLLPTHRPGTATPGSDGEFGKDCAVARMLMLLPLAIGLFVKARYDATAARVKPRLDWLSNVTFPVLLPRLTCGSLRRRQQRVRHYRSPILRCTA